MSDQPKEKKIIIDEDWKAQVQAEREILKHKQSGESSRQQQQPSDGPAAEEQLPPLPPASFPVLVSMLATQATLALGGESDHALGAGPQLDYAKHFIDLLAVVEEKTKGNLSQEEDAMLEDVLHQLRMLFVQAKTST